MMVGMKTSHQSANSKGGYRHVVMCLFCSSDNVADGTVAVLGNEEELLNVGNFTQTEEEESNGGSGKSWVAGCSIDLGSCLAL